MPEQSRVVAQRSAIIRANGLINIALLASNPPESHVHAEGDTATGTA
jgi:hypothetical protein